MNLKKTPFSKGVVMAGALFAAANLGAGCNNSKKPETLAVEAPKAEALEKPDLEKKMVEILAITDQIAAKTFAELVPDNAIREMIAEVVQRSRSHGSEINTYFVANEARNVIIKGELCRFFQSEDGDYCGENLYAAFAGVPSYLNKNIPRQALRPLSEARRMIIEKSKDYTKDPERLMALYKAKKGIIIEELNRTFNSDRSEQWATTDEQKMKILAWLESIEKAISVIMTNREEYKKLYEDYTNKTRVCSYNENPQEEGAKRQAYEEAERTLMELTPDIYAAAFMDRRFMENPKAVLTWKSITADMIKTIKGSMGKEQKDS